MKILVVKLTSMGDTLHLLPALSDLIRQFPNARIDWMVEDSFSEIPKWHASVDRVIPVSTRRWRSINRRNIKEFIQFVRLLRQESYYAIVDAQGLMKSAGLSRLARLESGGKRIGFSADSIKETFAARFYSKPISVNKNQHAIDRLRQLFAEGFDYQVPTTPADYAVQLPHESSKEGVHNTILFFPSTTWASKHLPGQHWRDLLDLVIDDGYRVKISWGNDAERKRAEWIVQDRGNAEVLPKSNLSELAKFLHHCAGAIAVDTGLGHMAAALGVPAVSVYGATDAKLTGAVGEEQIQIQTKYPCSPCFSKNCNKLTEQVSNPPCYQTISPADIWQALYRQIV